MIEPERLKNGYLRQNPFFANCLIVALANILMHDKVLRTVSDIDKFEKKWSKKYNVYHDGLQPVFVGGHHVGIWLS